MCNYYIALLCLRNDLYCVEWGVKLYSLTHSVKTLVSRKHVARCSEISYASNAKSGGKTKVDDHR